LNRTTKPILIILLVLIADQALKTWVRAHMFYGQEIRVIGHWFVLHYIENNGMAFGYEFAGEYGKIFLTLFRVIAVFVIALIIRYCIRQRYSNSFIACMSLILAGALGNIIDSVFYGLIYGYAPLMHGRVVDMLNFPLFESHFPSWVPFVGGQEFSFFAPVFNIADSAISVGVFWILLFQKSYFKSTRPRQKEDDHNSEVLEV